MFACAYGVAVQALVDPYREADWKEVARTAGAVLELPYWQMYGELQLER